MRKTTIRPLTAAFVLLIAIIMAMAISTSAVSAASDYTTSNFNVNAVVTENHVIHMTEKITVDFTGEHHGITRYIPTSDKYYAIRNIEVPGYESTTGYEAGYGYSYKYIRIESEDEYLTGVHTYTITYDLVCYRDESSTEDYLSLDLLPNGWDTAIDHASLTLTMPKTMDWSQAKFYAGSYGTKGSLSPYFTKSVSGNKLTITGKNVPEEYGVTVNSNLKEGYWVDPANRDFMGYIMWILLIGVPLLTLLLWFLFGRDPKIIRTVEFDPPEGMTPAEIGYIIDGKVDDRDMSSMLMYFAEKGYIEIREVNRGSFQVTKLKEMDPSEKTFAKTMFEGLFFDGEKVDLSDMPAEFGMTLSAAKEQLRGQYDAKTRKLFSTASSVCRVIGQLLMLLPAIAGLALTALQVYSFAGLLLIVPTVILLLIGMLIVMSAFDKHDARTRGKNTALFIGGFIPVIAGTVLASMGTGMMASSWIPGVAVFISMAITYFFVLIMKARTEKSAEWQGKILGFRDFIRDAEYDKLKALSDEDPEYFYNVMPYAYVMGMETRWAKKFENINIAQPGWYSSYDSGSFVFTALWYSSMINSCSRDFSSGFANGIAPAGDIGGGLGGGIGGGFGGGGFSGGGFGGGGGGAW